MVVSGLSVVGRDKYGVFPLKGKVMNVKDASMEQIMKNMEITNLKKILGLETGKKYKNTKSLRYGKVMIMTDQDHDGSHIKGLVMNIFHSLWPELLKLGYITSMITPIIKATNKKKIKSFYTLTEYQEWREKILDIQKITRLPLVLHGSSGISYIMRNKIARSTKVAKFNIGTELRMIACKSLRKSYNNNIKNFDKISIIKPSIKALKKETIKVIKNIGPKK